MSKLLKLKAWLTVEDAAKSLSIRVGEDVTEADILYFALKGHLTLSVYFVNHARGRLGRIEPIGQANIAIENTEILTSQEEAIASAEQLSSINGDLLPNGKEVLILEGDEQMPLRIEGVWDLLMLGAEKLDVEHAFQTLTGGPAVKLACLVGALVASPDRTKIVQLLDSFKHGARVTKPVPRAAKVEAPKVVQEALLRLNAMNYSASKPREQEQLPGGYETIYYPAGGLPDDSVLVVRTAALRELEEKLLAEEAKPEKPIDPRERQSIGQIIAALAAVAELDLSEPYVADRILRTAAARHGLEYPSSSSTTVKFFAWAGPDPSLPQ